MDLYELMRCGFIEGILDWFENLIPLIDIGTEG